MAQNASVGMTPSGQPIIILKEGTSQTKGREAQKNNIMAAKVISEIVRSSLGPRGMDKMLVDSMGDVTITNDGATILKEIDVQHPAAKMMVEVSKTADTEVGDGTTSVVILAGSLIEKAETQFDTEQAVALENKIRKNQFDLDDMLEQFKTIKKMGSISDILGMMPGVGALKGKINPKDLDEGQISRVEAIIHSMTPNERREPTIINGSRRKRIAVGSGTSITQVNQLLSQFKQMQKMMKKLSGPGGKRALMGMMKR